MTQHHAGRYVLNKPVFFIGFMGAGENKCFSANCCYLWRCFY